jgi:two-component sensor histidine kinase/putative methionine-R-sulfoxide reductase with GAF domain
LSKRDEKEHDELLRQQRTLARFGEMALQSEDLDEILKEACRLVGDTLGTDLAKVVELQEDGETLLVRAGVGWNPGIVGHLRMKASRGTSEGHALSTGEPVVSSDISQEKRFDYAPFLTDHGVKAIVNVIIIGARGRPPFGILQVDSREPREFTDDDIVFLRSYANLIAAAVERLRVFGEMRNSNQELERRVAERTHALTEANRRLRAEAAERERVQEALRSASKMETVVEHLPVGAALVSPTGQIILANPEFRRFLPGCIIPSADARLGSEWRALHADGQPILPQEFPAARALRGELALNMDFVQRGAEGDRWRRVSGVPVQGEDGQVVAALVVIVDVDEERRSTELQAFLAREVNHRAKNALAVVQAALRLTRAEDVPSFVRAIEGRVAALARAQTLLAADRWSGADLHTLLRGELSSFLDDHGSGLKVVLRGKRLVLPAGAAQPFSMAIHELATNAVKYGALSKPTGRLTIEWHVERAPGAVLRFRWAETGGPPQEGPPTRRGFGSRVLSGTLRDQLGGKVSTAWEVTGLVCDIELPLDRIKRADASEFEDESMEGRKVKTESGTMEMNE